MRLEEAELSSRRNAAVAMAWDEMKELHIPEDLEHEIGETKKSCERIIAAKDSMITELDLDLKKQDEAFTLALKHFAEDVDTLLGRMQAQAAELRGSYTTNIEEIESAFMMERQEVLEKTKGETDEFLEKKSKNELKFFEERAQRIEDNSNALEKIRTEDAEEHNLLKITRETEIQALEQQLEEMRATYQLNSEKLEYNYRVLMERDMENNTTITQHKRKIARLQDVLSSVISKYNHMDKTFRSENSNLTDEYRRITEQYKDLQNKFRHFEVADEHKFVEVADHQTSLVTDLAHKLLDADCIIHEQQLGLRWFPPSESAFTKDENIWAQKGGKAQESAASTAASQSQATSVTRKFPQEAVKGVLELLVREAHFLIDDRQRTKIAQMAPEDAMLAEMDAVLAALEVSTPEQVDGLIPYFLAEGTTEIIPAAQVFKQVKVFLNERNQARSIDAMKLDEKVTPQLKELHRKRAFAYWEKVSSVVSEDTQKVWMRLEHELERYVEVLKARKSINEDCYGLRQQNEELKLLLNTYLNAQVNDELHVPPTATIAYDTVSSLVGRPM